MKKAESKQSNNNEYSTDYQSSGLWLGNEIDHRGSSASFCAIIRITNLPGSIGDPLKYNSIIPRFFLPEK